MYTITLLFSLWAFLFSGKRAEVCTKQRCDMLKALLPFFIILCHHSQKTDWPWLLKSDFCDSLGEAVVGIFLFISGYGMECKRMSKGLLFNELPARLKRLFTPTLLPMAMYFSGLFVIGHFYYYNTLITLLKEQLYPLPYAWFVVVLAILYVGLYLCARITERRTMFGV